MTDQTHRRGDRTLEVPPQDPWAVPPVGRSATVPEAGPEPTSPQHSFHRGVAHVNPAAPRRQAYAAPHEPTGTGWPGAPPPKAQQPFGSRLRQLRRGGGLTTTATFFAFVGWGIWAVSTQGDLVTSVFVFLLTLAVAGGLFALARLLGRLILERHFGRVRRTARGAHLVTAVFLSAVGLAYLQQTEWVMDAWGWLRGTF